MALAGRTKDTGQPLKVGLLDADVYGPSIPQLMNLHGRPETGTGELAKGVKVLLSTMSCLPCLVLAQSYNSTSADPKSKLAICRQKDEPS